LLSIDNLYRYFRVLWINYPQSINWFIHKTKIYYTVLRNRLYLFCFLNINMYVLNIFKNRNISCYWYLKTPKSFILLVYSFCYILWIYYWYKSVYCVICFSIFAILNNRLKVFSYILISNLNFKFFILYKNRFRSLINFKNNLWLWINIWILYWRAAKTFYCMQNTI